MRLPVKINTAQKPVLARILPKNIQVSDDPRELCLHGDDYSSLSPDRFTKNVSAFKIDNTFKTTRPHRHGLSNRLIREAFRDSRPSILDIGISDGSTSVDLIRALENRFDMYYATDITLCIRYLRMSNGDTYFYNAEDQCVMVVTDRCHYYSSLNGAIPLLGWVAEKVVAKAPMCSDRCSEMSLVNPELRRLQSEDPRIRIKYHNIFDVWDEQKPDLIKVANVLNKSYFSDEKIKEALGKLFVSLKDKGRLLIIDNRDVEKASLFSCTKRGFTLEEKINGGSEITELVLSSVFCDI